MPAELTALDQRTSLAGARTAGADHPLRAPIPLLLGGYAQLQAGTTIQGANALATLPDGSRAVVLSYTNAGKVTERGIEVGARLPVHARVPGRRLVHRLRLHGEVPGGWATSCVPNTPSKKATFSLSYAGQQGFDANVTVRLVDGYQWAAGVFQGYVPATSSST